MSSVVRISEAVSLALHTAIVLAGNAARPVATHEIAEVLDVSENHLAKVLQRLTRGGIVESVRGPAGGFALAKDPEKITLLEVYSVIEGPYDTGEHLLDLRFCEKHRCVLGKMLEKVNREVRDFLRETTVADLAPRFAGVVQGRSADGE